VGRQRCAIERWQWMRSPRSVEPHQNIRHTVQISPPCNFWGFSTMKRELRGQNRLFHYPTDACGKRSAARFPEVGGAL
jgi:hypothetical protein